MLKTEIIGRDRALEILGNARPNRPVSQKWVERYAEKMRAGRFIESTLRFRDGRLVEGQHRLWAVVASGVQCEFIIQDVPEGWDETEADGYAQTLSHKMCRQLGVHISPGTAAAIKLARELGIEADVEECARTAKIAKRIKGGGKALAVALLGRKTIDDLEQRFRRDDEGGGIGVLVKWLAGIKRPSGREAKLNCQVIMSALDDFERGKPVLSVQTLTKRRMKFEAGIFYNNG